MVGVEGNASYRQAFDYFTLNKLELIPRINLALRPVRKAGYDFDLMPKIFEGHRGFKVHSPRFRREPLSDEKHAHRIG
jgi:hypothetical protein